MSGVYQNATTVNLTAYAELIGDSSDGSLSALTILGSQTLSISGQNRSGAGGEDERFFNFDLALSEPARSFVLEVDSGIGPQIHRIAFDALPVDRPSPPPPPTVMSLPVVGRLDPLVRSSAVQENVTHCRTWTCIRLEMTLTDYVVAAADGTPRIAKGLARWSS